MQIHDLIRNFRVVAAQPISELQATLYQLEHTLTGARLVWMDRASENKTFAIAFRTIPEDDTGVFHILEHSVLCGSQKYPAKEPFVELMKGSMQTFLNAFTFPDKTCYPVASRNDKDFMNLIRVYLDAVFFPAIYEKPFIYRQEGWHFELREGQEPSFKGVVFNEMKGVFASPDSLLRYELNRKMFPDTCYRFVSGGDPASIPDLIYEQFMAAHQRFYHPSNSYIYLDGSVQLDAVLQVLDEEYLSRFTRQDVDAEIPYQKPVTAGESVCYYEVSPTESLEKKARIGFGYGLGDYTNRLELAAMSVISDLLCGSNHAPLKQRILAAGLAEDVGLGNMDGVLQNYVVLSADNVDETRLEEFKTLVTDTVREQVEKGLDHEHIRSVLANMELHARERDYGYMPQGLGIGLDMLDSWLYGGDPAANLTVGPLYEELNRRVDTGWYEELLEKVMLHNDHTCSVVLLPSHEAGKARQQAEADRLAAAKAGWDAETLEELKRQQAELDAWQQSTDSAEDLAKIPQLELSDISDKPEDIHTLVDTVAGVPLLRHELAAGGISYWNLYFDISDFTEEELAAAGFLCQLWGQLGTEQYPALELQKKLNFYMGGLGLSVVPFSRENAPEVCKTYLCVSFSSLESKLSKAVELILEILNTTDLADAKQIQEILQQCRMQMEQMIIGAGNSIGIRRVMAGCSAEGVVAECTGGYSALLSIRAWEKDSAPLLEQLKALSVRLTTTGRLTLSVTGSRDDAAVEQLVSGLRPEARQDYACAVKPWGVKREGIIIPADISFAVQGGSLPYSGQMQVAAKISSLAYLWNAVRVQGGAYGAGMGTTDRGCGLFYSYRDPNAARSLGVYSQTADFLQQFVETKSPLTGYIIGTVSDGEPVLLAGKLGKAADGLYFRGYSYEDRCAYRKALLGTTLEQLEAVLEPIRSMSANGGICVVGGKEKVEACQLDTVYTL